MSLARVILDSLLPDMLVQKCQRDRNTVVLALEIKRNFYKKLHPNYLRNLNSVYHTCF